MSLKDTVDTQEWQEAHRQYLARGHTCKWSSPDNKPCPVCSVFVIPMPKGPLGWLEAATIIYEPLKPNGIITNLSAPEISCPSCGPFRGTMLRVEETSCWRCGWRKC